jgi:hypothetical protein
LKSREKYKLHQYKIEYRILHKQPLRKKAQDLCRFLFECRKPNMLTMLTIRRFEGCRIVKSE